MQYNVYKRNNVYKIVFWLYFDCLPLDGTHLLNLQVLVLLFYHWGLLIKKWAFTDLVSFRVTKETLDSQSSPGSQVSELDFEKLGSWNNLIKELS